MKPYQAAARPFAQGDPGRAGRDGAARGDADIPRAGHRAGQGSVTILGDGAGPGRPYVQALSVDGGAWNRPWLPESFALKGGRLDFRLGAQPNPAWGADPKAQPPSFDAR